MTLWLDFSPTLLLRIKGENYGKDKDFLKDRTDWKTSAPAGNPTLAAQLINMLYNVVDRIYIGHIPEGRSFGSYGCRRVSAYYDRVSICSAGRKWRRAEASIYMGQNNKEDAEKTLGNCFATQIFGGNRADNCLCFWQSHISTGIWSQ